MTLLVLFAAVAAHACGCFASSDAPVDQVGERILFRQDGANDWTAFVEVQFGCSQPNQDFAWLIPVQEGFDVNQDVRTAPAGLFDDLEQATAPRFGNGSDLLEYANLSSCNAATANELIADQLDPLALTSDFLLGQAVVGPYEIELLEGDTDRLLDWLDDAGYQLPADADEPLQHYVDQGFQFLGVKLNPSELSGPVETLVLDCGMTKPTVPLKLTAPAATPDMPITVYVLGDERVTPAGVWSEVKPDLRGVIDAAGYHAAVLAEQERAGGRAWTVDYAAPAHKLLLNVKPETAIELGHGGYITRLQAFVDPEEMDVDPVFVDDPKGPDVDVYKGQGPALAGTPWQPSSLAIGVFVLLGLRRRIGA